METDPSDEVPEEASAETGELEDLDGPDSEELEERDFNSDMLENGTEEIDAVSDAEIAEPMEDVIPDDYSDIPDSQEFESLMDEGASDLAGEDLTFDNEDLGDYEDMGDFEYLEDADVDPEEVDALSDAEVSPDSAAEDIGEIAEEVAEIAEEGEAIIAALL